MEFPELPADLSVLSDEELAALEDELVAAFADAVPEATTAESAAALSTLADAIDAIRAEGQARADAVAEVQATVTDLASRVLGQAGDADDDAADDDAADEPADGQQTDTDGNPIPEVEPGTGPAAPTPAPDPETGEAPAPSARAASGRPSVRQSLSAVAARVPAAARPQTPPAAGRVTITASADIPGVPLGHRMNDLRSVAEALVSRRRDLGSSVGPEDRVPVARFNLDLPEERRLSSMDSPEQVMEKIRRFTTDQSLVAAGGLCAPVAGYYDLLVLSEAHRPVRDALPTFNADRGGIRFNPPPKLSQITQGVGVVTTAQDAGGATVADGATTSGSATVTSATAAFTAADVGRTISGAGIPAGSTITAVGSGTSITISQLATATATGVTLTIGRGSKATFVVTCPSVQEVVVQAIYTSAQFGNFSARTNPEAVEAWTQLMLSLSARTAETALLDGIAANSTAVTSAGLVGGAREVLARLGQAAAGYRSRNRMRPDAPLQCLAPSWLFDMAQADLARTFAGETDIVAATQAEYEGYLRGRNVDVAWYSDSKTGGNQVIGAQAAGVLNQFPALAYIYLFAEGSFLRLDAGTLDLGLVRDSALIANNNFRMFTESFENVAYVGVESLEVALTAYPDGSYGAARTVTVPITT